MTPQNSLIENKNASPLKNENLILDNNSSFQVRKLSELELKVSQL
jgi:hypothetical protein